MDSQVAENYTTNKQIGFYLLMVATLGEELRGGERPCEESYRTATLVRHSQRHVAGFAAKWRNCVAQLQNTGVTCLPVGGAGRDCERQNVYVIETE